VQLAKSLWQQNQLRQARQVYESIEHMLSNNETVNAQFFPLYIHLKDFKKAEELLRKELKLAPKNPSTNANLALTLQQQGRYKQAIRHYDIALKAQPNDAAIWNNLGTAHQSAQTKIKAKFAFNKAVSLAPNNAKYQANYAIALMELEAFTEAEAVLKRAVQQDHRDPLVHSAIKKYFTATSSTQDPEELSYLFVLAELPEISDFHADFARYYEKRNRLEESRKIICDGLQITPGDTFLTVLLAQNARRLKQYDKAQELLANTTVKGLNDEQQQLFRLS
jgi:tetratricopeptide (TPR) repeat protein